MVNKSKTYSFFYSLDLIRNGNDLSVFMVLFLFYVHIKNTVYRLISIQNIKVEIISLKFSFFKTIIGYHNKMEYFPFSFKI